MLLDTGSELNIMTPSIQEETRLPIDPSGANWSLKGVSGHTVELVGLCRNVPLQVRGLSFRHHFFIARESIGDKDLIIGQPWLYNQASSINYLPGKGILLQIWEDSDHNRDSVKITIPILSSPQNVFHAKMHKCSRNANVSSLELMKINTPIYHLLFGPCTVDAHISVAQCIEGQDVIGSPFWEFINFSTEWRVFKGGIAQCGGVTQLAHKVVPNRFKWKFSWSIA